MKISQVLGVAYIPTNMVDHHINSTEINTRKSNDTIKSNLQLQITYIAKDMTKVNYYFCQKCLKFKGSMQFCICAADDIICDECKSNDLKVKYLVKYDRQRNLERMQFIYDCLLPCPSILRDIKF